jgi:hypothetical protein
MSIFILVFIATAKQLLNLLEQGNRKVGYNSGLNCMLLWKERPNQKKKKKLFEMWKYQVCR